MEQSEKPVGRTENHKNRRHKPSYINWHLAFIEAIRLELEDYKDFLEFITEYNLTTEPLRIDCIIIKKNRDTVIDKNIAAIFREVNLLEYKSPDDYISVSDFYKVYGYACLYACLEEIPVTCMTISIIGNHFPGKLIKHLKNTRKYEVVENNPGIYNVNGDVLPIQIIDSRRLPADVNLWLSSLNNRLDPAAFIKINNELGIRDEYRTKAYFDVITRSNAAAVREAIANMRKNSLTLEQVFEEVGWTAKWEARGVEKGENKWRQSEALDIARNMIGLGLPADTIIAATKLDPEKVMELYHASSRAPG
ncbi:MAG: hypothetical protein FWD78_09310 [Treponema sp.]|nr:hypothetical protein [Treponema sp.]